MMRTRHFSSALELAVALERSVRDDRVRMVICRGADMSCERRPEWWRWTVWMAVGITLTRCGIRPA